MAEAWNHTKYHSIQCSSSRSSDSTVTIILVFSTLKQQVGRKMEKYSILAYSTLPLGGGVECLVMTTEGLLIFYIKYPMTYFKGSTTNWSAHQYTNFDNSLNTTKLYFFSCVWTVIKFCLLIYWITQRDAAHQNS
jgi:hypothetical protein